MESRADEVEILLNKGLKLYKAGEYSEAAKSFGKILSLNPHHKEAYRYLIEVYDQIEQLKQQFAQGKRDDKIYHQMCIICLAEDRLDKEAEEVYEWMVENESPDKQVFFSLGKIYLNSGRENAKTIPVFEKLCQFEPDNLNWYLMLSRAYLLQEEFEKAADLCKEILEKKQRDNNEALDILIKASLKNKIEDIIGYLPETLRKDASFVRKLAIKVESMCSKILSEKEDAYLHFVVGMLYQSQNDFDKAITEFQKAYKDQRWKAKSEKMLEVWLSLLPMEKVVSRFFEEAGCKVVDRIEETDAVNLIIIPFKVPRKDIFSPEERIVVRCITKGREVFPRDVIAMENIIRTKDDRIKYNKEIFFLITRIEPSMIALRVSYYYTTGDNITTPIVPFPIDTIKEAIKNSNSLEVFNDGIRRVLGENDLYDISVAIDDPANFFGREDDIHTLKTKVNQRENFGIFGLRKVGKTSLLFQLKERFTKIPIAFIDLEGIGAKDCKKVYVQLLKELKKDILKKYSEVVIPELELFRIEDAGIIDKMDIGKIGDVFCQDLLRLKNALMEKDTDVKFLFVLDEIEYIIPDKDKGWTGFDGYYQFFSQLRGLYQQEKFLVLGVAGRVPNICRVGKWEGRPNPVFKFFKEVPLGALEYNECNNMVKELGKLMYVKYDSESLDKIYRESGGHPFIARKLCSCIINEFKTRPLRVDESMVDKGIRKYLATQFDYLKTSFEDYLSKEQQWIIKILSQERYQSLTKQELSTIFKSKGFEIKELETALVDLENWSLLCREGNRYRIKIQLFKRWLAGE